MHNVIMDKNTEIEDRFEISVGLDTNDKFIYHNAFPRFKARINMDKPETLGFDLVISLEDCTEESLQKALSVASEKALNFIQYCY